MLSSRVKHGTDNHEARSDRTFTHSKDETDGEETSKALASGMTTQSNSPDENVQAGDMPIQKLGIEHSVDDIPHPFSDGKPLQR